jgi:hypothetical protein
MAACAPPAFPHELEEEIECMSEQPDTRGHFCSKINYEVGHFFDESVRRHRISATATSEAIYSQPVRPFRKESFEERRRQANISFLYQGHYLHRLQPGGRGD